MKHWLIFGTLMLTVAVARADFFKADRDPGAALPADRVYPAGRVFPIGGFSPPAGADLRKLGFSLAGPVYGGPERMAEFARKQAAAGMPVIWQLEVIYKNQPMSIKRFDALVKNKEAIDWAAMDRAMEQAVREALNTADGNIAFWAITPEELRHWHQDEMEYLRRFAAVIRKLDGKKRPVWMYIPGHYNQSALEHYAPILDVLAQGYYPHAGATPRVWCRYWAENLANAAAKSGNKNLIVGVVPEMYVQPRAEELAMVPVWVRHDVFMPLIYGARFVEIFSLARRAGFDAHGSYFFAYSNIAKTLTRPGGLGEVLLFGERLNDLKLAVTAGPAEVEYVRKDKDGKITVARKYPTLAWADIRHASGRYLFAGSSAAEPVKARLSGLPKMPVAVFDAETGRQLGVAADGQWNLAFAPYEIKILRLTPRTETGKEP